MGTKAVMVILALCLTAASVNAQDKRAMEKSKKPDMHGGKDYDEREKKGKGRGDRDD